MTKLQELLQECSIDGNNIKMPERQLDRPDYELIKAALEKIGGKWKGGKISAFVFASDPADFFERISAGEDVDPKKQFQQFFTPDELVNHVLQNTWLDGEMTILEPSAGAGAFLRGIARLGNCVQGAEIHAVEIQQEHVVYLNRKKVELGIKQVHHADFLKWTTDKTLGFDPRGYFDRVIMNPPFNKGQDMAHVESAYYCLKPGGKLLSIMSKGWTFNSNARCTEFRDWVESIEGSYWDVRKGAFKESGTMVESVILELIKED